MRRMLSRVAEGLVSPRVRSHVVVVVRVAVAHTPVPFSFKLHRMRDACPSLLPIASAITLHGTCHEARARHPHRIDLRDLMRFMAHGPAGGRVSSSSAVRGLRSDLFAKPHVFSPFRFSVRLTVRS